MDRTNYEGFFMGLFEVDPGEVVEPGSSKVRSAACKRLIKYSNPFK